MEKGTLTREQAIEAAGLHIVAAVEKENCQPTNRVGYNGKCQGNDYIEWAASVSFENADGDDCVLVMYYYTDADDETYAEEAGWDGISWNEKIAGYEVE